MEPLERIASLEAELEQLKKEIGQKPERWKPYKESHFYIDTNGNISEAKSNEYNVHNCFRTRELAELRHKQRQAEDELFNIWEHLVGDWRPDWSNGQQLKYYAYYDHDRKECLYGYLRAQAHRCNYYLFPTEELAKRQYELASDHARAYIRGEF